MKFEQAINIINNVPKGFYVVFERVRDKILESDMFPDSQSGEQPIKTEAEAWALAQAFAARTWGKYVNIYVVHAEDFKPVQNAEFKMIRNR